MPKKKHKKKSETKTTFDRELAKQALEVLEPLLTGAPENENRYLRIQACLSATRLTAWQIELGNSTVKHVIERLTKYADFAKPAAARSDRVKELRRNGQPLSRSELMTRQEVMELEEVSTQGLRNRIMNMGHPGPVIIEGRKQWFNRAEVNAWREEIRSTSKHS